MSCAGAEPLAGKLTLILPEKPTGLVALMSSCGSVLMTDHVDSSMTNVNAPPASTRLEIVRLTGVGVDTVDAAIAKAKGEA